MINYPYIIEFHKPTHWTDGKAYINLNVDKIKEARKQKRKIVIKLPEGYTEPVDPKTLLKFGKKTSAVFLYPDNPMQLIGSYYTLLPKDKQEQAKEDIKFWEYL